MRTCVCEKRCHCARLAESCGRAHMRALNAQCLYVYTHIYICTHKHTHLHARNAVYTTACIYTYIGKTKHKHVSIAYIKTRIGIHTCTNTCIRAIDVYLHIHTHVQCCLHVQIHASVQ